MTKYRVEYVCQVPEWGDVTLDADTEEEAKDLALHEIGMIYPEAVDVEIEGVEIL